MSDNHQTNRHEAEKLGVPAGAPFAVSWQQPGDGVMIASTAVARHFNAEGQHVSTIQTFNLTPQGRESLTARGVGELPGYRETAKAMLGRRLRGWVRQFLA